jgi:hypothetical protein
MPKLLVCIETDAVIGTSITPEELAQIQGKIIAVYDTLNHEDDFIDAWNYSTDCINIMEENKDNLRYIFHELFSVFIQNGLITPEGKLKLEGYELGSYLSYAVRTGKTWYEARLVQESGILKEIDVRRQTNKSLLRDMDCCTDEVEFDILKCQYDENEEYIKKDRTYLRDFNGLINTFFVGFSVLSKLKGFDKKKRFDFDITLIQDKIKPSFERLVSVAFSLLKDDKEFIKVMEGIKSEPVKTEKND